MAPSYFYTCKVCQKDNTVVELGGLAFVRHIRTAHGLEPEDYHLVYVLGRDRNNPPVCVCGCGQSVMFRNLARGYDHVAARTCKRKIVPRVINRGVEPGQPTHTCEICAERGRDVSLKPRTFREHLEQDHGLTNEQYYIKYVLKADSAPTCACGCGGPLEFLSIREGYRAYSTVACGAIVRGSTEAHRERLRGYTSVISEYKLSHDGMTPAEWAVWSNPSFQALRPKRSTGITVGPRRWIIPDFFFDYCMLIVEIDGWSHRDKSDLDSYKESKMAEKGWTTIRFSNQEAISSTQEVVARIQMKIADLLLAKIDNGATVGEIENDYR